jgi:Flp pilus assembly protein TadD
VITGLFKLTFLFAALSAPQTAPALKPLSQNQVLGLVKGGVATSRIESLIRQHGLDFKISGSFVKQLQQAGARPGLIDELEQRAARTTMHLPAPDTRAPQSMTVSSQVAAMLQQARQMADQSNWVGAEGIYRTILRLDPSDVEAHFALGHVLKEEKKFDQAIAEYRETIRLAPDLPPPHFNLGNVLVAKKDFAGAAAEYGKALQLQPQDDQAHYALGYADYKMGRLTQAISEFRAAIALQNSDSDAHTALGIAYVDSGLYQNAVLEFHRALRINSHDSLAHAGLGDALLKEGDRKGALEEYRYAASLEPENLTYRSQYNALLQALNP